MASELGMTLVAEGIESEEDAIKLGEMGCQYGQSFYFGPPIGADSVLRLLKERFPLMKRG
jgi:EAL domain-containing protein (putative c-di-GMP-specific phosphodiesterase class I)